MKILLLATHLNLGGVGIYTSSLARSLKESGEDVVIASSGGDLVEGVKRYGIEHIDIPVNTSTDIGLHTVLACLKLMPVIKNVPIDIIHAQTRVTQVIANMLSKNSSASFVTTCHGFFKNRFFRRIFPCWGQEAIAISDAVRQHLVCDFKLPKSRVSVIYNGIDTERFNKRVSETDRLHIKKEYGLKNAPVIGIISRLSDVKGHKYLINAFTRVLKAVPDAQLLIIGDGKRRYSDALKGRVKSLGLDEKVRFYPSCRDTSIPLSIIDVFCHPSLQEGLGLSILEAMAMGIAVVASDVGGIYTLIKDKSNGLLVPPKDEEALSEAIILLLSDRKKAEAMGRLSKSIAQKHFTLEEMTKKVVKVYEKAIGKDENVQS